VPIWHDGPMSELVRVYATADQFAGQLMQGRLESEGIPVLLKGDGGGPYRAGPVYLFVTEQDEARAKAVIDAVDSGAYALDEGEPIGTERP
jgi:hypothetical protein